MGFRDLFQKKLQQEQSHAVEKAAELQSRQVERTGLLAEVEPKLKTLTLEVFDSMRDAGWPPITVTVNSPTSATDLRAYAFTPFQALRSGSPVVKAMVIDSAGQLAFSHDVRVTGEWPDKKPVSCDLLDKDYEYLLSRTVRSNEPRDHCLHLTDTGELWLSESYVEADDLKYRTRPLVDYLAERAARTIAGTA